MKANWKKRLTAIALVCLMVLAMVPEAAMSVYAAAPEDEILVGTEEVIEQAADVPAEFVEDVPDISEEIPETVEGSEEATEEFIVEDAEEVIVEDAPVVIEEAVEPEIQSDVPAVLDEENEVVEPEANSVEAVLTEDNDVDAEEIVGASSRKIKVVKEWSDGNGNHPNDKVTATITGGGTTQTVELSAANNWEATVAATADVNYTVEETGITSNGQDVKDKYEKSVSSPTASSETVWVAQSPGNLISGETYVFTYTSGGTTYALGRDSTWGIEHWDGISGNIENGVPQVGISERAQWSVEGSGTEWTFTNVGTRHRRTFTVHNNGAIQTGTTLLGWPQYIYGISFGGLSTTTDLNYAWKFTPHLRTTVTTNEYKITNTKKNDYQLVYDANGGSGAPEAQTGSSVETSYTFDVSTTAPIRGEDYTFEGWATTSGATTADVGTSVTVSTIDEQVDGVYTKTIYAVWKAREKFYVYHTGVAGGNIETIYKDTLTNGTYDLTQSLTNNTLYGGYYLAGGVTTNSAAYDGSNWTFTTAETTPGTSITPTAGETYYVKEVPTTYLKPTTYILYDKSEKVESNSACKGLVRRLFAMTAVDDERYQSVGFDIGDMENAPSYENSSIYTDFTVYKSGNVYKQYDAKKIFGVPGGNLAVANTTDGLLKEDNSYTMTPYWITMDGIKVTSAYVYSQSIGDCYHYGWVAPGITKAMDSAPSILTVQAQTVTAKKLAVSRFTFNDDETTPTETVTPTEAAEPTAEPTEEAEPTETVEPTEAPTEEAEPTETVEPEDSSTEDPASTETPTTTPMSPSNNSGSGALANLLRLLRSIFS